MVHQLVECFFSFWKLTLFCFFNGIVPVNYHDWLLVLLSPGVLFQRPSLLNGVLFQRPNGFVFLGVLFQRLSGLIFLGVLLQKPSGLIFFWCPFPKTLLCPCWYPFPKAHPPYAPLPLPPGAPSAHYVPSSLS